MKMILGSSSPRRQKLLSDWGYRFDVLRPQIDEKMIRSEDLRLLPLMLASAKAENLRQQITQPALLITCDTIVLHDGRLYEKPGSDYEAREMLQSYGLLPAEVICGVVVTNTGNGRSVQGVDSAKVYFQKIPHNLIEEMIKLGRIFDFAGAFHPDDPPIKPYIAYIEGEKGTVMGLPRFLTKKLIDEVYDPE
ncbi:MAG: Maf family protein [Candidatus Doudnabacteria bacterium]